MGVVRVVERMPVSPFQRRGPFFSSFLSLFMSICSAQACPTGRESYCFALLHDSAPPRENTEAVKRGSSRKRTPCLQGLVDVVEAGAVCVPRVRVSARVMRHAAIEC